MATQSTVQLSVRSVVFGQAGHIPKKYSCEGENVNPPLDVTGFPPGTRSLAIIVEDPDAPRGVFYHWIAWNIRPNEPIDENSVPGLEGTNSFGNIGYGGPCPPSGTHRYFFRVFALDTELQLGAGADKDQLEEAMDGHILAEGELMGLYHKEHTT